MDSRISRVGGVFFIRVVDGKKERVVKSIFGKK